MRLSSQKLSMRRSSEHCRAIPRLSFPCATRVAGSLLLAVTLVSACQQRENESRPVTPPVGAAPASAPHASVGEPDRQITPSGIGEARTGMTIGELRAALPPGTVLGPAAPFMVDVQGLPVVRGADTLYYVLVVTGEPLDESAPIPTVATRNPSFRTLEGVGPGTPVATTAEIYGPATLSYNTNDESREYATFAHGPAGIRFRVAAGSEGTGLAGRYATRGEYNTTGDYDPTARIALVTVDLRGREAKCCSRRWSAPRSARAAMVSAGLAPTGPGITDPSATWRPG